MTIRLELKLYEISSKKLVTRAAYRNKTNSGTDPVIFFDSPIQNRKMSLYEIIFSPFCC